MGWERRAGSGGRYYYRITRTPDGKVLKEYCGHGEQANATAAAVARSQAQHQADRQAVQEELARLAGPDMLIAELVGVAGLLMEAILLSSGFHRRNFGPWRKRRGDKERSREAAGAGSAG